MRPLTFLGFDVKLVLHLKKKKNSALNPAVRVFGPCRALPPWSTGPRRRPVQTSRGSEEGWGDRRRRRLTDLPLRGRGRVAGGPMAGVARTRRAEPFTTSGALEEPVEEVVELHSGSQKGRRRTRDGLGERRKGDPSPGATRPKPQGRRGGVGESATFCSPGAPGPSGGRMAPRPRVPAARGPLLSP